MSTWFCLHCVDKASAIHVGHVFFVDFCPLNVDKKRQKVYKNRQKIDILSTWSRRTKKRYMFSAPFLSFWCRLSTRCRQNFVDFCQPFVDFGRFLSISTLPRKLMSTSLRHKIWCRHHVDVKISMVFVVFCRWYFGIMSIFVDRMSLTCVEHEIDKLSIFCRFMSIFYFLLTTSEWHRFWCRLHVDYT